MSENFINVYDKNGHILADSDSILNRWKKRFCKLLKYIALVVLQREREEHTAETLLFEPNSFGIEIAIGELKIYISPGTDQIPSEQFEAESITLNSVVHILINSTGYKE
jgi:hypothetical protein